MRERRRRFPYARRVGASILAVAGLAWGVRFLAGSGWLDRVYTRGLYPKVGEVLHAATAWTNVPLSGLVLTVFVGLSLWQLRVAWRRGYNPATRMLNALWATTCAAALASTLFLLTWGYNYGRPSVRELYRLDAGALPASALWAELRATQDSATRYVTSGPPPPREWQLAEVIRQSRATFERYGLAVRERVALKRTPPGWLLRFGTSGVYFPVTGEAHYDAALHAVQKPFVAAHELAHGQGITDEGEANLMAYLTLQASAEPTLRYAGHLGYFRYLGSALRRLDPTAYAAYRDSLPAAILTDLDEINLANRRFAEVAPALRDAVYDSYLRSQGVREGMGSYSRVIDLIVAWRRRPLEPRES